MTDTIITAETMISLAQAARLLPPGRRGRPVTLGCILRWILHGVPDPDGARVRLEALRVGGRWVTSREAIQRFAEALTPRIGDKAISPRTLGARHRASERAGKALTRIGI